MDIIPGVKAVGHEHCFIIAPVQYMKTTTTLRLCKTCGLTHRLAQHTDNTWYWKHVLEVSSPPREIFEDQEGA
jgi:hypothetical protein